MDLPVYTSLLRVERRLYHIGRLELPRPVTLTEAAVFVLAFGLLVAPTRLLHIAIGPTWLWLYLVVPWLASWASTQPLADSKRLHTWALSQLRYLLTEPRVLARLRPVGEPRHLWAEVLVWRPTGRLARRRIWRDHHGEMAR
ncbi:MAG TPA: TcpE family conjugal transfer membrane protein [Candidatus Dormibacteraeota bacterium]|nr:TcpE family conjugal transfer membrane protein [Candidatus Dormibacteraeota bacterium]